jgi:hypothetical protein
LLISLSIAHTLCAGGDEQRASDVHADYALGVEDYSEAIRLQAAIVRLHRGDALTHYHLGFAEGMMGKRTAELDEYQGGRGAWTEKLELVLESGFGALRKR